MDPNLALERMRVHADKIRSGDYASHDAEQLADLFGYLDRWISKGGFLPSGWQPRVKPSGSLTAVVSADDAYSLYESLQATGAGTMGLLDGQEVHVITDVR